MILDTGRFVLLLLWMASVVLVVVSARRIEVWLTLSGC